MMKTWDEMNRLEKLMALEGQLFLDEGSKNLNFNIHEAIYDRITITPAAYTTNLKAAMKLIPPSWGYEMGMPNQNHRETVGPWCSMWPNIPGPVVGAIGLQSQMHARTQELAICRSRIRVEIMKEQRK